MWVALFLYTYTLVNRARFASRFAARFALAINNKDKVNGFDIKIKGFLYFSIDQTTAAGRSLSYSTADFALVIISVLKLIDIIRTFCSGSMTRRVSQ